MGKKFVMSVVVAMLAVVFLAGCGKPPKHWFYFKNNGYINLSKVSTFDAKGTVQVLDKDNDDKPLYILGSSKKGAVEINKENIEKALGKLEKYEVKKACLEGYIKLDGHTFELPTEVEKKGKKDDKKDDKKDKDEEEEESMKKYTKDEIKEILNGWLDIVNDVKAALP